MEELGKCKHCTKEFKYNYNKKKRIVCDFCKANYRHLPEVKDRKLITNRRYELSEKGKVKAKQYRQLPEVKARKKQYSQIRAQRPEIKLKKNKYHREYFRELFNDPVRGEKERERRAKYNKKRRNVDCKVRLDCNISRAIRAALNGNKKGRSWEDLVGYGIEDLKRHLEKQFGNDMTWENYGDWWHIDHIVPKSVFNYINPEHEDFKRCWSLENLQPLYKKENLAKYNKLEKHFQPSLLI